MRKDVNSDNLPTTDELGNRVSTLDPTATAVINEAYSRMRTFTGRDRYELYDYLRYTASRLGKVDAFYVGLFQPGGHQIRYPYAVEDGVYDQTASYQVAAGATSGWMLKNRRTYRFSEDNGALLDRGVRFGDLSRRSADVVTVPMFRSRVDDVPEVYGIVSMHSHTPHAYPPPVVRAFELLCKLAAQVMVREVEDRETLAQLHLDGPLSSLIASNHFADTLSVRLGKARLVAEQVLQDPEADIETLRRSLGDLVTASRMVQTELVELQLQITEGPSRRYASLTDREKAVAIELADEASNAEIAARLVVSTETVKSHIASIRRKYEMSDRSAIGQEIRQHLNHSRRRSDSEH